MGINDAFNILPCNLAPNLDVPMPENEDMAVDCEQAFSLQIPVTHQSNQDIYEPIRLNPDGLQPLPPPKIFYGRFWRNLVRRALKVQEHK